MTIAEIKRMSTAERIQTMEALWDSLIHEDTKIESPDWHKDVLTKRIKSVKNGTAKFLSIDELKDSLKP